MQKKLFVEVACPVGAEQFELAIGLLYTLGYQSFREDGDMLYAYLPHDQWSEDTAQATRTTLAPLLLAGTDISTCTLEERNWNAEWEASLQPIVVSERLLIAPSGKSVCIKAGQLLIEINPKMSFGTGYHETTRLMLRALEQTLLPNDRVLDIGTGTGILAIAARKLGNQQPILAIDNDLWAVENARENIAVNACSDIEVRWLDAMQALLPVLTEMPYTLILANLNRTVLEGLLPMLSQAAPQARVLISGILKYDEPWLRHTLRRTHYRIQTQTAEGEWLCALLQALEQ